MKSKAEILRDYQKRKKLIEKYIVKEEQQREFEKALLHLYFAMKNAGYVLDPEDFDLIPESISLELVS